MFLLKMTNNLMEVIKSSRTIKPNTTDTSIKATVPIFSLEGESTVGPQSTGSGVSENYLE